MRHLGGSNFFLCHSLPFPWQDIDQLNFQIQKNVLECYEKTLLSIDKSLLDLKFLRLLEQTHAVETQILLNLLSISAWLVIVNQYLPYLLCILWTFEQLYQDSLNCIQLLSQRVVYISIRKIQHWSKSLGVNFKERESRLLMLIWWILQPLIHFNLVRK